MEISISPELEEYVASKIESGRFTSPREVIEAGLEALRDEELELIDGTLLAEFNTEVGHRLESLDRGECADPEAVRTRIMQKSELRKSISV